jgi:hypothetical protein
MPGSAEATLARFTAPVSISGARCTELLRRARHALASSGTVSNNAHIPAQGARSFLQAVAEVLQNPELPEALYAYSRRMFRLSVKRSPDPKATDYFRDLGMLSPRSDIVKVHGTIQDLDGGKEGEFRVWAEKGAARPLPLRIEYQPNGYIRLTLEAVKA